MKATTGSIIAVICVWGLAIQAAAQTRPAKPAAPAQKPPAAAPAAQKPSADKPAAAARAPMATAATSLAQVHLMVSDIAAHQKFWVDLLGATAAKVGSEEAVRVPNLVIFLNQSKPKGGSKGTIVDHIAFDVPDVKAVVTKLKEAKVPLVTRAEVNALYQVTDDVAYLPDQATSVAVATAPDDLKVEFVENKQAKSPIALRHLHFAAPNVTQMKEWYVNNFGATIGNRGFGFESLDLPRASGVLTFTLANDKVEGTDGRVLDHIGFEVRGLAQYVKKLERAGAKVIRGAGKDPASGVMSAVVADPWGTKIELTQGLK